MVSQSSDRSGWNAEEMDKSKAQSCRDIFHRRLRTRKRVGAMKAISVNYCNSQCLAKSAYLRLLSRIGRDIEVVCNAQVGS